MNERRRGAPFVGSTGGDAAGLAARVGASVLRLEVVDGFDLTPSMRRLRLRDQTLRTLSYEPGQDLMVAVPVDDSLTTRRRYTIRRIDRDTGIVDLDISRHSDGPGARWATEVAPGDEVDAIGPRGKVVLDGDADWHLFIGDETFVPAVAAMVEAVPGGRPALAVIEVDGSIEEQPLSADPCVWVHRGDGPLGDPALLTGAASAIDLPPGRGHAYVAGEKQVVAEVKAVLLGRGMTAEQVSAKSYWRLGVANAPHGEPGP